ncbi:unnamed protein product [Paramecium octaurelia]|uniref:Transmembrane protein n=1 Tax=Paramecium octaurelia TaxID=43137 RepID=A0A8S1TZG9_PAROT|nr:unnamed protein product [Paramecium octaurelia]
MYQERYQINVETQDVLQWIITISIYGDTNDIQSLVHYSNVLKNLCYGIGQRINITHNSRMKFNIIARKQIICAIITTKLDEIQTTFTWPLDRWHHCWPLACDYHKQIMQGQSQGNLGLHALESSRIMFVQHIVPAEKNCHEHEKLGAQHKQSDFVITSWMCHILLSKFLHPNHLYIIHILCNSSKKNFNQFRCQERHQIMFSYFLNSSFIDNNNMTVDLRSQQLLLKTTKVLSQKQINIANKRQDIGNILIIGFGAISILLFLFRQPFQCFEMLQDLN